MAEAFPVAQRDGILTEHVDGELVVVDSRSQQAHALPALAATVWSLCDGNHGVAAIAARTGFSPDQITDVLAQLRELDLLETAGPGHAIDRRAMLTRTAKLGGAAALAAPILTVALPAAAAHASGTSASYYISPAQVEGGYAYYVSPPNNGAVTVDNTPGTSTTAYAGSTSPASPSVPNGESYVEIGVDSSGNLLLTLVQYNNAGSATYTGPATTTDPNPTSSSVSTSGSSEPAFSGSATLVVSAT